MGRLKRGLNGNHNIAAQVLVNVWICIVVYIYLQASLFSLPLSVLPDWLEFLEPFSGLPSCCWCSGSRSNAFLKQIAANSILATGIAADWPSLHTQILHIKGKKLIQCHLLDKKNCNVLKSQQAESAFNTAKKKINFLTFMLYWMSVNLFHVFLPLWKLFNSKADLCLSTVKL